MKWSVRLEKLESCIGQLLLLLDWRTQGELISSMLPFTDTSDRFRALAAELTPEDQMSILNVQPSREAPAADVKPSLTEEIVWDAVETLFDTLSCLEQTCLAGALLSDTLKCERWKASCGKVSKEYEVIYGFVNRLGTERLELLTKWFGKVAYRKRS